LPSPFRQTLSFDRFAEGVVRDVRKCEEAG
jgi:hypothetical protein